MLLPATSEASTIYVSITNGSNSYPGTPNYPVRTLRAAYDLLDANFSVTNTINIFEGTYDVDDNGLLLSAVNVYFVALNQGQITFSCNNNRSSPFIEWGNSGIYNGWWTTYFQGIVFDSCQHSAVDVTMPVTPKGGGMLIGFTNCEFTNGELIFDGGPSSAVSVNVNGCSLSGSSVAFSATNANSVDLDSCTFSDDGVAIQVSESQSFSLSDSSITSCTAPFSLVLVQSTKNVVISNTNVNTNRATGNIVDIQQCPNATISFVQVSGNQNSAICFNFQSSTGIINNLVANGNNAYQTVAFSQQSSVTWTSGQLEGNQAQYINVGIDSSTVKLSSVLFQTNQGTTGGAITVTNFGTWIASYCTFTGNSAFSSGGAFYAANSTVSLNDCTFSGNSAQTAGGAGYCLSTSFTQNDCTFNNNRSGDEQQLDCGKK